MKINLRFLATAMLLSPGSSRLLPQKRPTRFVIAAAAGSLVMGATAAPAQALPTSPEAIEYVVVLREGSDSRAEAKRHRQADGAVITHVYTAALSGFSAKLTPAGLAAVKADPLVELASCQTTRSRKAGRQGNHALRPPASR